MKPADVKMTTDEPLCRHCTLKIGGPADYFFEPSSEAELAKALAFARAEKLSFRVIGRGSNILFDDNGFRGMIIKLGSNFSSLNFSGQFVTAQAGAWMPFIARSAQARGLAGLEHTIGIPGSLGGMVVMNGGSQRKAIGDNIVSVRAMLPTGDIVTIASADCKFRYRSSIFQEESLIVLEATLLCNHSRPEAIRKEMLGILKDRRKKFPLKEPNCGSVFKSDPYLYDQYGPPGKVIEDLGFKGRCKGGIFVSERHANFFVNRNNGTARDFLALVDEVRDATYKFTNSLMMAEVLFLPSEPS